MSRRVHSALSVRMQRSICQAPVLAHGPESVLDSARRHHLLNPFSVNCVPWSEIRQAGHAPAFRKAVSRNLRNETEEGELR
jgi:hypothetical protein